MGLSFESQSNGVNNSQTNNDSGSTRTTHTPNPVSLPPAALDLASRLFEQARAGETAALHAYLTAGIPANLTNAGGNTLLMLAAYHGHASTVTMLIAAGADVEAVNDRGQTPLAGAVFKGYEDVVDVLVQVGADSRAGRPNAVDTAKMFRREDFLRRFGVPEDEWHQTPGGITLPAPA